LLIAILVPGVSAVRRSAKNTASQATLGTLDTALQAFNGDGRVGGGYPPSASDGTNTSGLTDYKVESPYTKYPGGGISGDFRISGAGLLVWALAGADFLGTPGFRVFDVEHSEHWAQDTHDENEDGAYYLDANEAPFHARSGPYVDLTKVPATRYNKDTQSYDIPKELEARSTTIQRKYPMFLDAFGFPILYWRADSAGLQAADEPNAGDTGAKRGIYHWKDNEPLISNSSPDRLVLDITDERRKHRLDWQLLGHGGWEDWEPGNFQYYILNKDIQAKAVPHRADSYLLVSPGADGIYGTRDDIANFAHNGN